MKDNHLKGCGKVFAFSLKQLLKSKGNIITIAFMCLMSIISMPLMALTSGAESEALLGAYVCDASAVYIVNESSLPNDESMQNIFNAQFSSEAYGNTSIHLTNKAVSNIGDTEIVYVISDNTDDGGFLINALTSKDTSLGADTLDMVGEDVRMMISRLLLSLSGMEDASIDLIFSGVNVSVMDYAEYADAFDEDAFMERFIYQYIYSIIVLMICSLSVSYIIRAVIEEKSSKLVELLMISVKPLSLIIGKILAIMIYILIMIASVAASISISFAISKEVANFTPASFVSMILPEGGVSFSLIKIAVIIVSVFVAYVTMSLIAGLLGTACSSTEDMQSASLASTMILLVGYLASTVITATDNTALTIISSLCPIVSTFCAPVNFLMGSIDIYVFLLSLLIQLIVLSLLALLCGRVYKELIVYNGKRLKFMQIVKMGLAKGGRAK